MKFPVFLVWLSLATASLAAPKFAVVRVSDIYQSLPSTAAMLKDVNMRRAAIPGNKRNVDFLASLDELRAMETQLKAMRAELDTEAGKALIRSFELKRQESLSLKEEYDSFLAVEQKRINKDLVDRMRGTLNRITEAVNQIAKERNLEGVFDITGKTNTGVPFVLYVRDAEDISDDVLGLLGEKPLDGSGVAPTLNVEAEKPAESADKPVE
jgi:Skp family chaperone for outer membrane proteins